MASGAFVLVFLAIQFALPLIQLMRPGPSRFGWQMFSRSAPTPKYALVLPNGQVQPVDLMDYAVNGGRAEIDYDEYMPAHLCRVFPEAIEIRIGGTAEVDGRAGEPDGEDGMAARGDVSGYACP